MATRRRGAGAGDARENDAAADLSDPVSDAIVAYYESADVGDDDFAAHDIGLCDDISIEDLAGHDESKTAADMLKKLCQGEGACTALDMLANAAAQVAEYNPGIIGCPTEYGQEAIMNISLAQDIKGTQGSSSDSVPARAHEPRDDPNHRKHVLEQWARAIVTAAECFEFVGRDSCARLSCGCLSMVELLPAPLDDTTGASCTRFIHWDQIKSEHGKFVGRWVRLDHAHRVVYAPPTSKVDVTALVDADRLRVLIPDTTVRMIRRTGPGCPEMGLRIRFVRELHDHTADLEPFPCCCVCQERSRHDPFQEHSNEELEAINEVAECRLCRMSKHAICAGTWAVAADGDISDTLADVMNSALTDMFGEAGNEEESMKKLMRALRTYRPLLAMTTQLCLWCSSLVLSAAQ